MIYNMQKLKLFLLQKRYSSICKIISLLQEHVNLLMSINYLELSNRMQILNDLFEITKILNSKYNEFINNEICYIKNCNESGDSITDSSSNLQSKDILNNQSDNSLLSDNESLSHLFDLDNYLFKGFFNKEETDDHLKVFPIDDPLDEYSKKICNMIEEYGLGNINNTIEYYFDKEKLNILKNEYSELFNELESSVTCIGIEKIEINKKVKSDNEVNFSLLENDGYYLEKPSTIISNDYLERTRHLYLRFPEITTDSENSTNSSSTYIILIKLLFKNDYLSINLKSSQINLPILYKKKNDILNLTKDKNLESKFVKMFVRYDYIGNIYSYSVEKYVKHIEDNYNKFMNIIGLSILNLMKEFLSKNSKVKDMYDIIFLLLLGDDENYDVAGILLGLLKEKKNQVKNIYNLIYENLSFYLQSKVKKSSSSVRDQIEKLKKINVDNIDYSKQLVTNKNIPENVKSLTIEKIEEMKSFNNEYFKQLTFVKHIINYPWPSLTEDQFYKGLKNNSSKAQQYIKKIETNLLDASYGHEEAKKSLLQIIGKWVSNPGSQGTSFGLVGPPGVGKTLLAKSVSKALDIPFAQITLGGQNDGEILHGHGYTYSGSQPGMIIKKMVEMGKSRCILYFDELDKACSKHGQVNEITSILIHLTDPNMNKTFQDRFFQGIDFPLDKVIMMFSYNDSSLVDPILLDRLKEINVSPYSLNDKLEIVNNFITPELVKSIGLEDTKLIMNNETIEYIVENYTQEAGVRDIKRKIEEILLHLNLDKIYKRGFFSKNVKSIKIDKDLVCKILKNNYENNTTVHEKDEIGIINGLYATSNGNGGIVPIQIVKNIISHNDKSDGLILTGSLGDVMKESVNCSLTCAKQYLFKKYGNKKSFIDIDNSKKKISFEEYIFKEYKNGFHVHTPSTSTPKDGPSAGCAFTCAFISTILNKKIKRDIAMTGEIELTGKITKIGGLIYKLIGAKKAGVKEVFVSSENKKDVDEIKEKYPKLIDENFRITFVNYIEDFIDKILN